MAKANGYTVGGVDFRNELRAIYVGLWLAQAVLMVVAARRIDELLLGDLAASQAMRLRFLQEADATSRLDHPNVVSVLDIGRGDDGGPLYLVMDLVDGTPLFDLLLDGPLAPGRAINLARGVFLGLAHAHERGLIHRDLKPDNIIVAGIVAGIAYAIVQQAGDNIPDPVVPAGP